MSLEADIACLRKLPLFRGLPSPRLKLVALMGERLRFSPGDAIVAAGDAPEALFVILSGKVAFSRNDPDRDTKRIVLDAGDTLGDIPLLCGQNHTADVTASSEVEALRLPKDVFFELLRTVPDFNAALTRDLAFRLYRLADRVLDEEKVH